MLALGLPLSSRLVAVDLAGMSDGVPERFVPETMGGQLIEAEHLSRYAWAAPLAQDRSVLDAGCGLAYGSAMLAEAGARAVLGVDRTEPVLEAARARVGDTVRLQAADLLDLPFADGEFQLVVCFEVIEHVEEPLAVLDELRRVLTPDGLLAISSPNRNRSQGNNPHHRHEFEPDEFERELSSRWEKVRMLRQHNVVGSLVYDPAEAPPASPELRAISTADLGDEETYTIALCGAELPSSPPCVVLSGLFVLDQWISLFEAQKAWMDQREKDFHRCQERLAQLPALRERLSEAEQQLSETSGLRHERDRLAQRARSAEAQLAAVHNSRSWRVTAPLRRIGAPLRRIAGNG